MAVRPGSHVCLPRARGVLACLAWCQLDLQRRMQAEGVDAVYRGVPLPCGAKNLGEVMKRFEREERRAALERRHAQLAKVYPTLYGGSADGAQKDGGSASKPASSEVAEHVGIFKKEFGHLSEGAQLRFREDSLWMGQAERVMRYVAQACDCRLILFPC